jgi:hypothetical protein
LSWTARWIWWRSGRCQAAGDLAGDQQPADRRADRRRAGGRRGLFLIDKLIGDRVARFASVKYTVKGPWKEPKITFDKPFERCERSLRQLLQ